jgi:hypothetical protein
VKQFQLAFSVLALWAAASGATSALACEHKTTGTSASAASVSCPGGADANAAAAGADHCAGMSAAACKSAGMKCSSKGAKGASAISASAVTPCHGDGFVKVADASIHADCDGCADMARCAQEMAAAGARVQVVPLKNGVMYMYTAETSSGVRVVQAAVSRRNERLAAWTRAGDGVHLCNECKAMRGAAASGKLVREIVNIEGGSLTLLTSSDPQIVHRLHEMASASLVATRTRS